MISLSSYPRTLPIQNRKIDSSYVAVASSRFSGGEGNESDIFITAMRETVGKKFIEMAMAQKKDPNHYPLAEAKSYIKKQLLDTRLSNQERYIWALIANNIATPNSYFTLRIQDSEFFSIMSINLLVKAYQHTGLKTDTALNNAQLLAYLGSAVSKLEKSL